MNIEARILLTTTTSRKTLSLTCPGKSKSFNLLWKSLGDKQFSNYCHEQKKVLRIGYNINLPFFKLQNGIPDMESLEAMYIATFIEVHHLNITWIWAENKWGRRDKNGMVS